MVVIWVAVAANQGGIGGRVGDNSGLFSLGGSCLLT